MKVIPVFILIAASTFGLGCSDESVSSESVSLENLFPLQIGNTWTISETNFDTSGTVVSLDTSWIHIDSAGTLGTQDGYYWNTTDNEVRFAFYAGSDLKIYHPDAKIFFILLRYPMNVNDEVIILDTTMNDGSRSKSVLRLASANTSVTVPAGTFRCYNYETINMFGKGSTLDTSEMMNLYVSSGTGLVKQDEFRFTASNRKYLKESTQLIKFEKN